MQLFYSPAYMADTSAETTQKAAWIAASLAESPVTDVRLVAPEPATGNQLCGAHDPTYVESVLTGWREGRRLYLMGSGFSWSTALVKSVLASTGGVLDAVQSALMHGVSGSLSSGLHHARHAESTGLCTFNGLAVAARQALLAGSVERVLILDLDAHFGGGTFDILGDDRAVHLADISTSDFDQWRPTSARHHRLLVNDADAYLPKLHGMLAELAKLRFDLVLYNAGVDCHTDCPMGGLLGLTTDRIAKREEMVFSWCAERAVPVAFVLAGGYCGGRLDAAELVGLHRLTVDAAARCWRRGQLRLGAD